MRCNCYGCDECDENGTRYAHVCPNLALVDYVTDYETRPFCLGCAQMKVEYNARMAAAIEVLT